MHRWNRGYLLLSMLLPLILPFLDLRFLGQAIAAPAFISLPEISITDQHTPVSAGIDTAVILAGAYLAIAAALLVRLGLSSLQLRRTLRRQPFTLHLGIRLREHTGIGPGSFGRTIFFPGAAADAAVLQHEVAHIRHGHRYDLLLTGLLGSLCWANPFLLLLARDLKLVHEFQADADACAGDAPDYAGRLLNHIFHSRTFPVAHAFFHSPIKHRIMMLQKEQRPVLRSGLAVAAAGLTLLFSAGALWAQTGRKSAPQPYVIQNSPEKAANPNEVHNYVEQMPEFKGDLTKYLTTHIKYPEVAVKENRQGRVIVRFVIDKKGGVSHAAIVKSSADPLLDKEALRVVSAMPAWEPGKKEGKPVSVYYNLPITFRLDNPIVK
jgi:TonB family protein